MYCMYNESELGFWYNIKTTRIVVNAEFIRQNHMKNDIYIKIMILINEQTWLLQEYM